MSSIQFVLRPTIVFAFMFFISCTHQPTLDGVYQLNTLQKQDSKTFTKYTGVEIRKTYLDGHWTSVAYDSTTGKSLHSAGGTFSIKNDSVYEQTNFHSANIKEIGRTHGYAFMISEDTLLLSGMISPGTSNEWKVEEKWVRRRQSRDIRPKTLDAGR